MATAIYKAAAVTLDENLASQMKIKKDVEMETEGLRVVGHASIESVRKRSERGEDRFEDRCSVS